MIWLLAVPIGWVGGAMLAAVGARPPLREPWMLLLTIACFATAWWPLFVQASWCGPLACCSYGAAGGLGIWGLDRARRVGA